jgi:cholestenol delta-isomerase
LLAPDDATYFDLFRHVTIPSTTSLFPSTFWKKNVLQVAETESAVWHAIIALGILHKGIQSLSISNEDRGHLLSHADKYYGKALSLSSELNSAAKLVTLSIVLVAAANMLGRWAEAQRHILAGLNIVSKDKGHTPALRPQQGTLPRTELQLMTFGESTAPYPFEKSTTALPPQVSWTSSAMQGTSYEVLASEFFDIARAYCLIDDRLIETEMAYGPWLTRTDGLLRRLAAWETHLMNFEASSPAGPDEYLTKLSLRMFHATLRLMLKATPFGPETRYDALLGICEYIVRLAATVSAGLGQTKSKESCLSFEPGVILPLWVVTHRCRHLRLRRAALRLLSDAHRIEGIWSSDLAASIMTEVLAIEEEHIGPLQIEPYIPACLDNTSLEIPMIAWQSPSFDVKPSIGWEDVPFVPEEKRVKDIMGVQDLYQRSMKLTIFTAPTGNADGYGSVRQPEVSFGPK